MGTRLDNPFRSLVDAEGEGPDRAWKLAGGIAGLIAADLVRWAIERSENRRSQRRALASGKTEAQSGWFASIGWAAFIAVGGTLGRLFIQRLLAAAWRRRRLRRLARAATT
jgi:hypothetical protein